MFSWLSIAALGLKAFNGLMSFGRKLLGLEQTAQAENAGEAIQSNADQTANAKASENAAIIDERDAALTHDQLVAKVEKQTGVSP